MQRALVVGEAGNVASRKTAERRGGIQEELRQTDHRAVSRYWIELDTGRTDAASAARPPEPTAVALDD